MLQAEGTSLERLWHLPGREDLKKDAIRVALWEVQHPLFFRA